MLQRLSTDLLRNVMGKLATDPDENVSKDATSLLIASKEQVYDRLVSDVHVLDGAYGHVRIRDIDPYLPQHPGLALLNRAARLSVEYHVNPAEPANKLPAMVQALCEHPHVALTLDLEAFDAGDVDRAMLLRHISPIAGLRELILTSDFYERECPLLSALPENAVFPHLTKLVLADADWWLALHDRAPALRALELRSQGPSDCSRISNEDGGFLWERYMSRVPELRRFAIFEHPEVFNFGAVVMTASVMAATTPRLTELVLGYRWSLRDAASPSNHLCPVVQPALDPAIFHQVKYLKLYRNEWPGDNRIESDPFSDDSISRSISVAQLEHLEHLTLSVHAIHAGSLRDFGALTALERLTILADCVYAGNEENDGDSEEEDSGDEGTDGESGGDTEEETVSEGDDGEEEAEDGGDSEEEDAPVVLDVSCLVSLPKLTCLTVLPASCEDQDEIAMVEWPMWGLDELRTRGCTVRLQGRPDGEYYLS